MKTVKRRIVQDRQSRDLTWRIWRAMDVLTGNSECHATGNEVPPPLALVTKVTLLGGRPGTGCPTSYGGEDQALIRSHGHVHHARSDSGMPLMTNIRRVGLRFPNTFSGQSDFFAIEDVSRLPTAEYLL